MPGLHRPARLPEREKDARGQLVLILRREKPAAAVVNDGDDIRAVLRDCRRERLLVAVAQAGKQVLFVHAVSSNLFWSADTHIVGRQGRSVTKDPAYPCAGPAIQFLTP